LYNSPKNAGLGDELPSRHEGVERLAWERHDTFEAVRECWIRLQESGFTTPFQRIEWAERWSRGMGVPKGDQPVFILGAGRNGPAILLPLVLRGKGVRRHLAWLGDPANDYNVPLMDPGLFSLLDEAGAKTVLDTVARLVPEAAWMSLSRMPPHVHGLPNPFCAGTVIPEADGVHLMEIDGSWTDFELARWSKNTRHRFRQKRNQLLRQGRLELRRMANGEEQAAATQKILEWKHAQLQARGSHNPFSQDFVEFLKDVSRTPVAEIWGLEFEGQLIAGVIGLQRRQGLIVYQIAYDNGYAKQSPGRLAITDVAQMLVARGDHILDFGFGDEEYKAGLATRSFPLFRKLVPLSATGRVSCAMEAGLERIRRSAKKNPLVTRLYFALRRSRPGEAAAAD
jgi:CelD/BcsL family acetyltransferase involved in cellulose biosynthesis